MRLLISFLIATLAYADEAASKAKKVIEDAWARSLADAKVAKTTADLDRIHAYFDAPDWTSVQQGRPTRTWEELRKYPVSEQIAPFEEGRFVIDDVQLKDGGRVAVVTGVLKMTTVRDGKRHEGSVPLRETWVKTDAGWRRKIHEKLIPYR